MGTDSNEPLTTFDKAWEFTSKWEGGYSNHPNDPGGSTMYGITQRAYTNWLGEYRDVKEITKEEARAVAKQAYWDYMGLDEVSPELAIAVFDWGFHSGPDNVLGRVQNMTTAQQVMDARMQFLTELKNFNSFGRGWVRRVEDLRKYLESDVTGLDVEVIQVFNDGGQLAAYFPAAVSMGTTNSGRTKIMVRFK